MDSRMTSRNMFLQCPYRSSLFPHQIGATSPNQGKGGILQAQFLKRVREPLLRLAGQQSGMKSYYVESSDVDDAVDEPQQQDDVLKNHYMNIVNGGLHYAYQQENKNRSKRQKSSKPKIIVVGAGASGLSAAYELERAGYETTILELQHRVGGRLKTISDGFAPGLHAEGGAMRIPSQHYLTHAYIKKFDIGLREFTNYNEKTFIYLDRTTPIRTKDWKENNAVYSDRFFPGWNLNIDKTLRPKVEGINDYFARTIQQVKDDLDSLGWDEWVKKWSRFSVNTFLRDRPEPADGYRPWPEDAIRGLQVSVYSPSFDTSLVEHLRDEIGQWMEEGNLQTPINGMQTIAESFISFDNNKLGNRLHFGVKVESVNKTDNGGVSVTCRNTSTWQQVSFEGDAVIVTVPLTILRQMEVDLDTETQRAIANFYYESSSKVLLQCRTRFWETDIGFGGFSKTDMPIGQIHYPSKNNPPEPNARGILVCYTKGQDALIFGSQREENAVASAVTQVAKIHPEMEKEFEVGRMQAWFSDPSAQGAFACLHPHQYNSGMETLMTPRHPIYLAGEAISYTNAWAQGAFESGLRAAYQLYSYYQQ